MGNSSLRVFDYLALSGSLNRFGNNHEWNREKRYRIWIDRCVGHWDRAVVGVPG